MIDMKKFIKENIITKNPNRLNSNLFSCDFKFAKEFWESNQEALELLKLEIKNCQGGKRKQHPCNEACYRILNDINGIVKCKKCNNPTNYHTFSTGYHDFCSSKCQAGGKFEEERKCVKCNSKFTAFNPSSKYCSVVCNEEAEKERNLEKQYSKHIKMLFKNVKRLIESTPNCEICDVKLTNKSITSNKSTWFNVDHCHKTGKVRGILCSKCNRALGGFSDNIDNFKRAIEYLKQDKEHYND